MKINQIMKKQAVRALPLVGPGATIAEVAREMAQHQGARMAYVVSAGKRLLGVITMGSLLRHLYPHHYEGKITTHGMLKRVTAVTAEHLMDRKYVHTTKEGTVDQVLERMAATGVKEMAILDARGRIEGAVSANDLLRHFHLDQAASGQ